MTQDEQIQKAIEQAKYCGCGTMMIYGLVIATIILL